MNKASGNGIPAELFQSLEADAVKVLHSIYQQIWKTQRWPQDWKRSVFIPFPKKGFLGGSDGKWSTFNAEDPGSISGWGRSPGEGNGNHSSILAWRIPWTEEPRPWGCKELDMTERLTLSLSKMGNAKKCSNYHTFALISHAALSPWHNSWWTNHMAHLMKKEDLEMLGPHKNILCIHKTQIIKEEP